LAIILVIEDEPPLLVLAESLLKQAGYLTIAAARVAEAKPILDSEQELNAIFTDISLADDPEGGLEIGRLAARRRPALPVLYTTGRGVTDTMIQQFVEPSSFLAKPYTGPQLVTAIANLLRSNPPPG
jgi:DNA-binding NtrC family response regulator